MGVRHLLNRNLVMRIFLAMGIMFSLPLRAADSDNTPFEIALLPYIQLPGTDFGVTGLRLSGIGLSREVRGLDLALLGNITKVEFKGIAISGLFNYNRGGSIVTGLQVAGLANINSGHSEVYGLQIAGFNCAGTVYGLQLGLLNIANELHGIQIGVLNINRNGPFHASPIINAAF
jgi:hypothetical protein